MAAAARNAKILEQKRNLESAAIAFPALLGILSLLIMLAVYAGAGCTSKFTLSDVTDYMRAHVVQINILTKRPNNETESVNSPLGTGFLLNAQGYVITAHHLIEFAQEEIARAPAGSKAANIVIPPPAGMGIVGPAPPYNVGNDFDVIAVDKSHDIALLRIRLTPSKPDPFRGSIVPVVTFARGGEGTLSLTPLNVSSKRLHSGDSIGILGYQDPELRLASKAGRVTSGASVNLANVKSPIAESEFSLQELRDAYDTDFGATRLDSGGPVSSLSRKGLVGMYVTIVKPDGSTHIVVVPSTYVLQLVNDYTEVR